MAKSSIAAEALENYKLACDSYEKQLTREIDDLKFQVPELQWDELSRRQRSADTGGNAPTPARPMLSIPKLDQPIQLVLNQERAAHLGVNIHPLSEDADDDTAEVLQGLYRKIERDSRANIARSWAFERAVKAGRGAYRVNTCYDDDSGNPFDQKITIERILYQECVKFDPSAKEPDYSDGEWAFVTQWMPIETFKRLYPKATVSMTDEFDIERTQENTPEWVKGEGDQRAVQVAEYFKKVHKPRVMRLLSNGQSIGPDEEIPPGVEVLRERETDEVSVMWYKLAPGGKDDGLQVLEEQEWNGKYIPLIPVIGRELQPFDSERRWVGVFGPAKDAQRLYNYAASTAVEVAALEPKAPFIGVEGQFEGHEQKWNLANIRSFPYLEYKPVDLDGRPAPPPQRVQIDVGRLGPSMALLQQADDFIQASTSTPDPALGNLNARDRSGKAIQALQGQADASTSHYMHNLAQVSMTYEAKVILDMIPRIYDRPGRIARTLDLEDNSKQVMLNAPFVEDEQTGRPRRVDQQSDVMPFPQRPMGMGGPQQAPAMQPPKPKVYDLRKGSYGVSISIGKSWSSRLQEGADEIGQILQAQPQLMPMIGPVYFKFRDFPGAKELAEILKKVRDKQFPGLDAKEGEAPDAAALQSQLQAAQQQIQMMQGQLQQAAQAMQTEHAKQQATVEKARLDAEAKSQTEQMKAQAAIELERVRAEADMRLQAAEERFELLKLQLEQQFEAMQKALDRKQAHEMAENAAQERAEHADEGKNDGDTGNGR